MSTIQDVAKLAGVSTATVSRVLNGYAHVSPPVLEKVVGAIEQLGYEPNQMAKSLRTLKTSRIIVTVPDIANPFFANIIRGVEEAAQVAGYTVLLGDVGSTPDSEEAYAGLLRRKEADGMIFLGHTLPASLNDLIARKGAAAPVVNGCEFSADLAVSSVHIDNAGAAREAMDYLYALGHRRIGIITGDLRSPISRDRLQGVNDSARTHGRASDLTIVTGDYSIESGVELAARLAGLATRPTAIFCFSDDMAFGALHALRQAGLNCPGDVSVVGFDDVRLAQFGAPTLTTIRQPMREIGARTVELLIGIIENGVTERINITLDHKLIIRDSTAPPKP
ncbi:LacI family DNA-binding transcriptional regulator [Asticcacaulis sp. 201]|uniref:LacI family DNA-binding transcriptional regulator n=1 Tax=Asticcacaulis sp. 201 TaxID=3028787 RepID=UPI002916AD62|nr:LacI family DNA-binding transcriptional regulator [Asticcacaulis sp. 201]MDV6331949.1 LacI family DNA-binding transcriptional regulator [Asticcacaulis sp. 201]